MRRHSAEALGFKTNAERLIGYLDGSLPADAVKKPDLKKLERISQLKSWLFEYKNQRKVIKMMMNLYNYSEFTAYRDLKLMERVFGPVLKQSKEIKRALADEMINQDRELAIARKDTKSLPAITRNYILLHGLDKEDPEVPDLSDFEFQPIIAAVLPEQVGIDPVPDDELLERVRDWYEENSEEVKDEYDEKG